MDEIKDTPVDRAALQLLLTQFNAPDDIAIAALDLGGLNRLWGQMAVRWAGAPDAVFNAVIAWLNGSRDAGDPSAPDAAALSRASELVDLVTEARWEASDAAHGHSTEQTVG